VGAFARATQWVKLESLLGALSGFFEGKMLEKNIICVEKGFKKVIKITN
jgi:Pyruvate/2-oxoacid:ferredoxin oxidoreductase gamma subunit